MRINIEGRHAIIIFTDTGNNGEVHHGESHPLQSSNAFDLGARASPHRLHPERGGLDGHPRGRPGQGATGSDGGVRPGQNWSAPHLHEGATRQASGELDCGGQGGGGCGGGGGAGAEGGEGTAATERQQHVPAVGGLLRAVPGGAGVEFGDGVVRGNSEAPLRVLLRQVFEIVLLLFQVLYVPSELI